MTPGLFIVVALAGGVGAVARFALDTGIRSRWATRMPWGTIAVNLTGSLLLGLLVGLAGGGVLAGEWQWALGTGFLGGYTTFSTASFETVRLLQKRAWTDAVLNALVQLAAATALAGLGLWVGTALGAVSAG